MSFNVSLPPGRFRSIAVVHSTFCPFRLCSLGPLFCMDLFSFECFNQAFLAKHGWRLIANPDSLCARVLQARYYRNGDFLKATCPKQASYTW
jgi:hypothetical protein